MKLSFQKNKKITHAHQGRSYSWQLPNQINTFNFWETKQWTNTNICQRNVYSMLINVHIYTRAKPAFKLQGVETNLHIHIHNCLNINLNIRLHRLLDSLVVECWLRVREIPGSIPSQGPRHTKDVIKMVPVIPLKRGNTGSFWRIKRGQKM